MALNLFWPCLIRVEKPSELIERSVSSLGHWHSAYWGRCVALIADRATMGLFVRSCFVASAAPALSLPAAPWTASAVEVLVGQLATQLDQNLSQRVLSIAGQHEAVELTQLLHQQGVRMQCNSADPLHTAVLCMESSDSYRFVFVGGAGVQFRQSS